MTNIAPALDDLYDEYEFLDKFDRYRLLIEFGRTLEKMPEALKADATLVPGCASKVWVYPTVIGERILHFFADSDSEIIKGIIGIILLVVQDKQSSEVLKLDIEGVLSRFQLEKHLSSKRTQGIPNMIALIRDTAARYAA